MSEHEEQAAFVEWCQRMEGQYPELEYGFAIPNGGKRYIGTALRLKAEGVKAGVLDWHLPLKRGAYIGLWIEFKYGDNAMTKDQERWAEWLHHHGHRVEVAYSFEQAQEYLLEYLHLDDATPF